MFVKSVIFLAALAAAVSGSPTSAKRDDASIEASIDVVVKGTHTGDGTFYAPGLGACGKTNKPSDHIVAIGHNLFDNFPGFNGGNPNNNPVCGRSITATYKGKSVTVRVQDRCTGCSTFDLDFSPSAFSQLAPQSVGRIHGVKWHFN